MVGFPEYFHVPDGSKILKHPLYLKYNITNLGDINYDNVKADLAKVMATNDNMGIIWYLSSLIEVRNRLL